MDLKRKIGNASTKRSMHSMDEGNAIEVTEEIKKRKTKQILNEYTFCCLAKVSLFRIKKYIISKTGLYSYCLCGIY